MQIENVRVRSNLLFFNINYAKFFSSSLLKYMRLEPILNHLLRCFNFNPFLSTVAILFSYGSNYKILFDADAADAAVFG